VLGCGGGTGRTASGCAACQMWNGGSSQLCHLGKQRVMAQNGISRASSNAEGAVFLVVP